MTLFNFDELRAKRNARMVEYQKTLEAEYGVKMRSSFDKNSCYCACGSNPRGPCEHKWDGEPWESDDGCAYSVTCSLCGTTAMSHHMRYAP